jgi:hypothetical protein
MTRIHLALLTITFALTACAELAPLRDPPLNPAEDINQVETREDAIRRFGPPQEMRSSDLGLVMVYRRGGRRDSEPLLRGGPG